jgi:formate/nitrite transporter
MGKVLGGAVFSVGLVLVVIAGAELFTGNIIMIIGAITRMIAVRSMAKNWLTVYGGNFVGSILVAVLIWNSGLLGTADNVNELGTLAAGVAEAKLSLTFGQCFIRGIFCNMLVILAIILATMSKDVISKIFACVFPIMTFVACGFEHCVANMYLIPLGLFAEGITLYEQAVLFKNIIPVTLGNIVGGMLILLIHPQRIRQLMVLMESSRKV